MRKSEQVIYVTLIDFLLQLLFLGLVLWVIVSVAKPEVSRPTEPVFGSIENDAGALHKLKGLLIKAGIDPNDPDKFFDLVETIVDAEGPMGDLGQLAAHIDKIKDLMVNAGIKNWDNLAEQMRAIIDAAGDLDKARRTMEKVKDLFGAGRLDNLSREDIDVVGGIENALKLARQMKDIQDATGVDASLWADLIKKGQKTPSPGEKPKAPPHIVMSETRGLSFPSGSAKLSPQFRATLATTVVADIEKAIQEHHINLIEVIGHTDGMPVKHGSRQMDAQLEAINAQPDDPNGAPQSVQGSNVDLGMLRALEVVKMLREQCNQGKLKGIDPATGFRAYSSGPLTLVDGRLSDGQNRDDDPARRRIEIRLTQQGEERQIQKGSP